jgi:hypothetical protein
MSSNFLIQISDLRKIFRHISPATRKPSPKGSVQYIRGELRSDLRQSSHQLLLWAWAQAPLTVAGLFMVPYPPAPPPRSCMAQFTLAIAQHQGRGNCPPQVTARRKPVSVACGGQLKSCWSHQRAPLGVCGWLALCQ